MNQNKGRDLKRHLEFYETEINELHKLRNNVEESKIAAGEEMDKIEEWGAEFEEKLNIMNSW